ncbi:MAG TPA: rod shape-determining protein [Patescibacteria group bacterium]
MKVIPSAKSKIEELTNVFYWDIGIDLGSSNTLVYLKDRGIVIDEPTLLVRSRRKRYAGLSAPRNGYQGPVAYGYKAKEMLSREPKHLEVVAPLKYGIVSDLEAVEQLIAYYLKLIYEIPSKYPKLFKPRVIVGVPSFITSVQKRAVKSIFKQSGARKVMLLEESVLTAVGLGLPMDRSYGLLIVDIGGGKSEANLVSMGGIVVGKGIRVAGSDLDNDIINYLKMKYGLLIGYNSAERIKIEVATLVEEKEKRTMVVRGRDLETGLPKSVRVQDNEIREAISLNVGKIVKMVEEVLDETPPELMEDILKRGILLTGNGAKIRGLSRIIEERTKIVTRVVEEPGWCVIKGIGELIEKPELLDLVKKVSAFEE